MPGRVEIEAALIKERDRMNQIIGDLIVEIHKELLDNAPSPFRKPYIDGVNAMAMTLTKRLAELENEGKI